jgi:phosphonatase-like hydrolase
MIELVVFDLAGTTVYDGDAVNSCFRGALSSAGVNADPDAIDAVMGWYKPDAIRALLFGSDVDASEARVHVIHDEFVRLMCDYYAHDPSVREIPGAGAVFARLQAAGVRVAVNSGFSRPVVTILLQRLGWSRSGLIDAEITSDEVLRGRPHPEMIRTLMSRFGITDPARVAKIGDTRVDLEEGANAGCGLNIGVITGCYSREQLERCPHTHILSSVAELPALVLRGEALGAATRPLAVHA